ncbi:hypothetical protein CRUP_025966, partial [Coryphaenoides rupestris]
PVSGTFPMLLQLPNGQTMPVALPIAITSSAMHIPAAIPVTDIDGGEAPSSSAIIALKPHAAPPSSPSNSLSTPSPAPSSSPYLGPHPPASPAPGSGCPQARRHPHRHKRRLRPPCSPLRRRSVQQPGTSRLPHGPRSPPPRPPVPTPGGRRRRAGGAGPAAQGHQRGAMNGQLQIALSAQHSSSPGLVCGPV